MSALSACCILLGLLSPDTTVVCAGDCQEQVLSVRAHFEKLGIPSWMDVDGGMQVDVYDSMAQGVSNAAVVICFMTQRYRE